MLGEHRGQRGLHPLQERAVQRLPRVERRVARGEEQLVALAQRHVERPGQAHDHLAARAGPARLDEAHVARGARGLGGQVELAHPAHRTPVAKQRTQLGRRQAGGRRHAATLRLVRAGRPFPPRESPEASPTRILSLPGPSRTNRRRLACSSPSTPSTAPPPTVASCSRASPPTSGSSRTSPATAAASPALLAGFDGLRRAVASTKLDPVLREVTGLAVGVAVDNHYGVAFHSMMLAGLGVDAVDIDAMRHGRRSRRARGRRGPRASLAKPPSVGARSPTTPPSGPRRRAVDRGRPRSAPRGELRRASSA